MAMDEPIQSRILEVTDAHWKQHSTDKAFAEIIQGKEPGHRMADYVDDRTTALLKVHFDARYEGDAHGNVRKRSMGDIWLYSQSVYNPVNIKSGLQHMNGQPNLVSMQKLLDYILRRWIDSYYLLIVKFDISPPVTHNAYFVDMLDWTEYITYDAGPGQLMLKERQFYDAYHSGLVPQRRSLPEKVEILFALFERQLESMFANRKARLQRQRELLSRFDDSSSIVNQSEMEFIP